MLGLAGRARALGGALTEAFVAGDLLPPVAGAPARGGRPPRPAAPTAAGRRASATLRCGAAIALALVSAALTAVLFLLVLLLVAGWDVAAAAPRAP